ncbi:hypothetical protein RJ639_016494 [Escallonia herrerae]|uniref:HAT C-terminal dimerisation domain-containing protein n=1 Tax=Escallonia herrerae TaxID=1293975 RepID=A0AA89AJV6_9ASTE|nr:hypothetical protein RJ639_016494 [Escallonia herrerae]
MEYEVSKKDFKYNHAKIFHVWCCAHIINLRVQDGLSEVKHVIENVRESVKYINATESRIIMFSDIAKSLELPQKKLILDVATRWNSTHSVLAAALEFRQVFPWFSARDANYLWLPQIYNEVELKKNIELVSGSLLEVYKDYVLNHALHCSSVTKEMNVVGGSSSTTTYKAKGKTKYDLYVRSMKNVMPIKSDLETYLEEEVYICEVNCESQFDVIGWWKENNLKYKILSKMAVNILSIPITTVASEAALSTGGRVIDPIMHHYRQRLWKL